VSTRFEEGPYDCAPERSRPPGDHHVPTFELV
jgi:hypothetical protein